MRTRGEGARWAARDRITRSSGACVCSGCVCGPGLYLTLPEDDGTLSLDLFLTASTPYRLIVM